jgi:hypothetical protein
VFLGVLYFGRGECYRVEGALGSREGMRSTYFSHYLNAQRVGGVQQFLVLGLLRYPQ